MRFFIVLLLHCAALCTGALYYENTNGYSAGVKTTFWPNPVPYKIDSSLANNKRVVRGLLEAIAEIQNKTCVRFQEQTDEKAYLNFVDEGRCYSSLGGNRMYPRKLSLSRRCRTKGTILHHILHSFGFMIESNRPDRDQFVNVVWDNIPLANRHHFQRFDAFSSLASYFNIPYDYQSIMHPNRYWMGNYSVTLITNDYYKRFKIGQRKNLSTLDALSINLMYKCPGTTKPPSTIPPVPTSAAPTELKPYLQEKNICGFLTDNLNCRFGYQLWIDNAIYGRQSDKICTYGRGLQNNCSAPGAFDKVREKCHLKMECRLHAYNREFGVDPCVGTYKYLGIKYRCVKTDTMCGISGKTISCPEGQVLKLLDATYGRLSKHVCPTIYIKTTNCKSSKSLEASKEICEGQNSCRIHSSKKIFGDPCPGTIKYLQVIHQCVLPGKV